MRFEFVNETGHGFDAFDLTLYVFCIWVGMNMNLKLLDEQSFLFLSKEKGQILGAIYLF